MPTSPQPYHTVHPAESTIGKMNEFIGMNNPFYKIYTIKENIYNKICLRRFFHSNDVFTVMMKAPDKKFFISLRLSMEHHEWINTKAPSHKEARFWL